jgi:hypothetical protein
MLTVQIAHEEVRPWNLGQILRHRAARPSKIDSLFYGAVFNVRR